MVRKWLLLCTFVVLPLMAVAGAMGLAFVFALIGINCSGACPAEMQSPLPEHLVAGVLYAGIAGAVVLMVVLIVVHTVDLRGCGFNNYDSI